MRAVLQRVTSARVLISGREQSCIGLGLLAMVGVEDTDGPEDVEWLGRKIVELRIFDPAPAASDTMLTDTASAVGPRERSVVQAGGEILLVSQFTLFASTRKGTRPSWHRAARPPVAIPLYEGLHRRLATLLGRPVPTGVFGDEMTLELCNHGPVTVLLDSKVRE